MFVFSFDDVSKDEYMIIIPIDFMKITYESRVSIKFVKRGNSESVLAEGHVGLHVQRKAVQKSMLTLCSSQEQVLSLSSKIQGFRLRQPRIALEWNYDFDGERRLPWRKRRQSHEKKLMYIYYYDRFRRCQKVYCRKFECSICSSEFTCLMEVMLHLRCCHDRLRFSLRPGNPMDGNVPIIEVFPDDSFSEAESGNLLPITNDPLFSSDFFVFKGLVQEFRAIMLRDCSVDLIPNKPHSVQQSTWDKENNDSEQSNLQNGKRRPPVASEPPAPFPGLEKKRKVSKSSQVADCIF
jgi:hypothetical protein